MKYWLMKSEPGSYSIDDLEREGKTSWDGVRNYQARNFMRDDMRVGDTVFFYHSNTKTPAIVGIGKVCSEAYPDPTAFDQSDPHFDPRSKKENPTWYMVDVCFVQKLLQPITLEDIKRNGSLSGMLVAQRGSRLSVMPVEKEHGKYLEKLTLKE